MSLPVWGQLAKAVEPKAKVAMAMVRTLLLARSAFVWRGVLPPAIANYLGVFEKS